MIKGMDFAIHIELANTAGDELGILRTKVKDEDSFGHGRFLETAKLGRSDKATKPQRDKVPEYLTGD
ncbi:hypothetical protein GCM10007390_38130 [Persicitalea jodogahamensis]|uniref:Uncharacterized protein n=1 Tax=Persicitalea jodogahamensis TaxID=402147 RepID=A0A8J3GB95_9BACT|nr:hypothetical protein GCM10007390_38130 [Persicitalea jodogahamensis]